MTLPHYSFSVTWSPEDQEFVGSVAEFPSLSWLDGDRGKAFDGIVQLVEDVVKEMTAAGEQPPVALAERQYSGKFQVRTTPARHRQLTIEAAQAGVSMNRLINDRLASA